MLADGFVGWPVNLLTILGLEKRSGVSKGKHGGEGQLNEKRTQYCVVIYIIEQ